jgi:TonB family protein
MLRDEQRQSPGEFVAADEPTEWSEDLVGETAPSSDSTRIPLTGAIALPGNARVSHLYPGAVLRDRFVLQSRLQASGMSEVFKALDRRRQESGENNPWVAIKLVSPVMKRYPEALRLLQQEAALGQRLLHPNIVRVFDFDRHGDLAFITMEWLDGESLAQVLTRQRHRPLTSAHARQIVLDIGAALQFAHGHAITHADVKPGNIFLTGDGTAKLLDFGIARSDLAADDIPGADAHTPAYASCEVLEGASATPQDDVYSLACVAYRMLAGRRALGNDNALAAEATGRRALRTRHMTNPQWLALQHALAFRRAARTSDVATFLREFDAPPLAEVTPASPGRPRREWRLAVAAGIAVVVGVALTLLLRTGTDPQPVAPPIPLVVAPPAPVVESAPALPDVTPIAAVTEAPTVAATPQPAAPSPFSPATAPDPPAPARATERLAVKPAVPAAPEAAPIPAVPLLASVTPAGIAAATSGMVAVAEDPMTGETQADPAVAGEAASVPEKRVEVPLSALEFRRYVKPAVRRRSRDDDSPGWVELRFTVGVDGQTRNARITSSSPPGRDDAAALAAVSRWRFEPVIENGAAVERHSSVRLRFQPE